MNYLLGIDLGSTNIKAILYDENGIGTAQSSVGTPVFVNEAGLSVLDPEKIWGIICGLIKDVVLQLEDKNGKNASKDIAGIACTSIAESGVLLDKKGEPAFPIIMNVSQDTASCLYLSLHPPTITLFYFLIVRNIT